MVASSFYKYYNSLEVIFINNNKRDLKIRTSISNAVNIELLNKFLIH